MTDGTPLRTSKLNYPKENKMKKTFVLLACLLALAFSASAQNQINFANLPLVSTPTPMPSSYFELTWSNIFYVDPAEWSGAGSGYKLGPLLNQDVAFVGESGCRLPPGGACYGSISVNSGGNGINNPLSFQPVSATVAGGFGPTEITVIAYNNGNYVGSAFYSLGNQMQTLTFPSSWGNITELTFKTSAGGALVFYDLQVYWVVG
jgi:hypothetical protein